MPSSPDPAAGLAFLLSQVGAHSSARFAERLEPLGFKPAHAGILRVVRDADGLSQQALGEALGVFPSRLVGLIDEIEGKGLIERRNSPADRRAYALYLTAAGRDALQAVGETSREHQASICAAMSDEERAQLADMLRRIVAEQGLAAGVHPGFGRMGGEPM
ncbi:MAG: Transcriptional regulator, MarR family [Planctomycetota bacterium]|nr:Transcriptional regulator, MarR family [Planctomycetota bacterium]